MNVRKLFVNEYAQPKECVFVLDSLSESQTEIKKTTIFYASIIKDRKKVWKLFGP